LISNRCKETRDEKSDCVKIIDNGDPSEKLDVVFLADAYSDINDFVNDVQLSIDGIFSTDALAKNYDKFNFYYVNKLKYPFGINVCMPKRGSLFGGCKEPIIALLSRKYCPTIK
jgi:hypothetical protein